MNKNFPNKKWRRTMPMSTGFMERLMPGLPTIIEYFVTPFHIYDEAGLIQTGRKLLNAFGSLNGFNNFYAVKALPNPKILEVLIKLGMGFDCSSVPELNLARLVGARPEQIMFTSNNTSSREFAEAMSAGGCILNLDDADLIGKVPQPFPELICFRYNPGPRRQGIDSVIGSPEKCKYGVPHEQIVEAYREAMKRGAKRFGLHTMVVSNELEAACFVDTTKMLLEVAEMINEGLGIAFEFINIGGGLGIPYKQEENAIDLDRLAKEIGAVMSDFQNRSGYLPKLSMECGRFITGPHGVLVTSCINRKSGYEEFAGVDCSAISSVMRPPMYQPTGGYHHLTVHEPNGCLKTGLADHFISVVGSACENNDRFGSNRQLPEICEGDLIFVHDTGAHCSAMANNYNGRLYPKELLLRTDGSVQLIRREQTEEDLWTTLRVPDETLYPLIKADAA